MKDEYGNMDSSGETFVAKNFVLESGQVLKEAHVRWLPPSGPWFTVSPPSGFDVRSVVVHPSPSAPQARYSSFGTLNAAKDNLLVVCHALTGNSRLDQWWGGMLGPGRPFDTSKYLVVCANVLGSCYGSTGPQSPNPDDPQGRPYGAAFPDVTIRDTVRLHMLMAREGIGAARVACVVGGSMGGMQALEWALLGGDYVRSAVSIGCGAAHTAWQIAMSETQRQAIYADPRWRGGAVDMADPPLAGLAVARQFAMLSYRTARGYHNKFGREVDAASGAFQARRYLEYQGRKFVERFDPVTYVKITEQMDRHDVGHGRGGVAAALGGVRCPYLVMGIDSDLLYPLHEQEELAQAIPGCDFRVIHSPDGHDGFLLEQDQVGSHLQAFLDKVDAQKTDAAAPS